MLEPASSQVRHARLLLRLAYAFFLFLIALDKLSGLSVIADWGALVGPVVHTLLPFSLHSVILVEGTIELAIALLLLRGKTKPAAILFIVTVLCIILDLIVLHDYNLALREVMLIVGMLALWLLDTPERA